jgi:23S rRNA pseudouridine1911/1915/1917 synthase
MLQIDLTSVTCHEESVRLDKFLFTQFPEYSRSYFQKLIENKQIYVNERSISKNSHLLKSADVIKICFMPMHEFKITPQKVDFEILDQQEDFLIINKPAGLVVHQGASKFGQPSLVHGLLYHFQEFQQFDDKERPGIVHRLDKDTSGILLIARNPQAQIYFSNLFKNRDIRKTYLALVKGHPNPEGTIALPIGRHPAKRHMMSTNGICSRQALTFYQVKTYFDNQALLEVKPITGRTHQIRVHLAAQGHGILGDQTYGVISPLIRRQALHAWQISFEFKGKQYNYTAPLPADFEALLNSFTPLTLENFS